MDEQQAFITWPGEARDVRGQELDRPVGEDPAAEAAGEQTSA
ncbi:hypothetical protein [Streptomyces sp. NPDC055912]